MGFEDDDYVSEREALLFLASRGMLGDHVPFRILT